jgi:DNA-binding Lrp family transcriptional regulator
MHSFQNTPKVVAFSSFDAGIKTMDIDKIDTTILSELTLNARASQVDLAERVGLSSTAIARRQKVLEEEGFIRGYQAVLDLARFGLSNHRSGQRHPGKPERGGVEILRGRGDRLSVGGSMLPDVR